MKWLVFFSKSLQIELVIKYDTNDANKGKFGGGSKPAKGGPSLADLDRESKSAVTPGFNTFVSH